jgi:peptidoglycan/LPS O-acetylase OafA/YrhL
LDGLRGVAALYVVGFHAWEKLGGEQLAPYPAWQVGWGWLGYGRAAVAVFIVLSGYSLSLGLARSAHNRLEGGARNYLVRRARRILPPYYACLLLSWLLIVATPGIPWAGATPAFDTGVVVSHLLLVHHLSLDWIWKINAPLWSIGTEWTIYFFLPGLLLPAFRRAGLLGAVTAGFVVGLAPGFLLPPKWSFWWAAPWYLGLFALGMAAALVQERDTYARAKKEAPWGVLALLSWGGFVLRLQQVTWPEWSQEALIGVGTASLLVWIAGRPDHGLSRMLGSLPMRGLGRFSYSLYLVHYPLVELVCFGILGTDLDPVVRWCLALTLSLLVSIVAAYAFFLVFERPTLVGVEGRSS